jgi:hypothetical protein
MQVALNDENVLPRDATLESVMPKVHQRFVAMDGTLKALDRKVVSGFEKLDTKVDGLADHFICLQANNRERDANAESIINMFLRSNARLDLGRPGGVLKNFDCVSGVNGNCSCLGLSRTTSFFVNPKPIRMCFLLLML